MVELPWTFDESAIPCCRRDGSTDRRPGLVMVFSCGEPATVVTSLADGAVELGRGKAAVPMDPRISRQHAKVSFDGQRFWVTDLGSKTGTVVDGKPIPAQQPQEVRRVIRLGDSLFVVCKDVDPVVARGVKVLDGHVLGPAMQQLFEEAERTARFGSVLHIIGESGTGKELLAQAFHKGRSSGEGPFIPVNCAAIPHGLAERLLFGTRRGAYSGADKDAVGYIQAAAGGTLFLDEVGELEQEVQAKLLRVLETKEVFPLGSSQPCRVDFLIVSATNKDLRKLATQGIFREDLYYRLGKPTVSILPLRKRPEELPYLVALAIKQLAPAGMPHVSLIEACLLQPWPGNIRELLIEVRSATQAALAAGCPRIEERHLSAAAGMALSLELDRDDAAPTPAERRLDPADAAERARIETALRENRGNMSRTARALGLHRTQLYRLIERHGLEPQRFAGKGDISLDSED